MIRIEKKVNCCGCSACVQSCPKQCITMREDDEGFLYPVVDEKECINCGLCEKVCPVINQNQSKEPLKTIATINPNEETRLKSSSGGVFTMLAEKNINEGGVVFGAEFDENWNVKHGYTETIAGLESLRRSKYVQSNIGESFKQAELFLKQGRKVLFSGTPCQVAGLKLYLRKEYDNLLTVDVACHGVPSPMVWRDYLNEVTHCNIKSITNISFRSKQTGWKNYSIEISKSNSKVVCECAGKNLYMQGFLSNLFLRPSCYFCPSKCGRSGADITLADYWGVDTFTPAMDDDKGTSLVLVNTKKGDFFFKSLDVNFQKVNYDKAVERNICIVRSAEKPRFCESFWESYKLDKIKVIPIFCKKMKPKFFIRCWCFLKRKVLM